jgi:hypothetical protein
MMRPRNVLRSVRELGKLRAVGAEGAHCGRIKDLFFEDSTWKITHLVLSIEPRQSGHRQVLVEPSEVSLVSTETGVIRLKREMARVEELPLASAVLPVCRQYASLALASPGARNLSPGLASANPRLRSARNVTAYEVSVANHNAGILADLVFDDAFWQVRYLTLEQRTDGKNLRFHVKPQSVERFTWATRRVVLRELQPVRLESGAVREEILTAA